MSGAHEFPWFHKGHLWVMIQLDVGRNFRREREWKLGYEVIVFVKGYNLDLKHVDTQDLMDFNPKN